jgi:hypothetical protein
MHTPRRQDRRTGRPGGLRAGICLVLVLPAIALATPARAQEAAVDGRSGPIRSERFPAAQAIPAIRPSVALGGAGEPARAAAWTESASLAAAVPPARHDAEPRSPWAVAGAALAGGALGWAAGAAATLAFTHERLGQEDLAPLLYAVVGGAAVSVPAGAVAAHWASRGHGSILTSTLLGYAATVIAMMTWPDGGWALGPAVAIPITIAVETL